MSASRQAHPAFFTLPSLALIAPLCIVGAVIGTELITTLGITANTSLIGALAGMGLARLPGAIFGAYRSSHMQNLAQSAISAATFGAGNAMMLPIGIPFALGRPDLVGPMLLGVFIATIVDGYMLYRLFDSEVFPAAGAWPPGVAAAEAIRAGDQGGRKGVVLLAGVAVGWFGALYAVPMSAFGVAFIGNVWALTMFGAGLLVRGYNNIWVQAVPAAWLPWLAPGGDIMVAYLPHGVMVGAGLVALVQVASLMPRRHHAPVASTPFAAVRRTIAAGTIAYVVIATLIALLGGLFTAMPPGLLVAFILYAALAALIHELIVGLAAMHAGWFPAFAVALITLVIGMLIGFPAPALCLLVGFSAATGPAFADMGYDLKAGYMLRGYGTDPAFEREGRRQQLHAAMFAFVVAGAVVLLTHNGYFLAGRVAPVDHAYVAAIRAGTSPEVARHLLFWAIPGAIVQWLGGPRRQIGILFATGLLIDLPAAAWAVLAGVALRRLWMRRTGGHGQAGMEVFAAGVIAGDALHGFYAAMSKTFFPRQ